MTRAVSELQSYVIDWNRKYTLQTLPDGTPFAFRKGRSVPLAGAPGAALAAPVGFKLPPLSKPQLRRFYRWLIPTLRSRQFVRLVLRSGRHSRKGRLKIPRRCRAVLTR